MIALVNVVQAEGPQVKPQHLPMGLIYLGSALKKAGYEVKLFHISQYQIDKVAREIAERRPLFMGVSVLTGVSTLHSLMISRKVRELDPSVPIIWGGHHASVTPEECLAEPCIDYVFMGEGEEGIVQFAKTIAGNGGGVDTIPGLAMERDGEIHKNSPPVLIKDLDSLEYDLGLLDNVEQYVSGSARTMMLQSSRGCPFRCGFCHIANFYGNSYRQFSVEYVLRHVKIYRDLYRVQTLHLTDDLLFLNKRDIQMMRKIHDMGMRFWTVALRISHVLKHPEILDVLRELDVTAVFLAWESGVDRILDLMHKDINQEKILQTYKLLADKYPDITCAGGGIIGNPTETQDEIKQTVDTAIKLRSIHPNCNVFLQLYLPLPGTEFVELAVKEGMARPKCAEDWAHRDPLWNESFRLDWLPWITDKKKRLLVELDSYYRRVIKIRRGGRLTHFVLALFSAIAAFRHRHLFFAGSNLDIWLFEKLTIIYRGLFSLLKRVKSKFLISPKA